MRIAVILCIVLAYTQVYAQKPGDTRRIQFLLQRDATTLVLNNVQDDIDIFLLNIHLFENLENLSINASSDTKLEYLKFAPKLETLRLVYTQYTPGKEVTHLAAIPNLKSLTVEAHQYISYSKFKSLYKGRKAHLEQLSGLQTLRLTKVSIPRKRFLESLQEFDNLDTLALRDMEYDIGSWSAFGLDSINYLGVNDVFTQISRDRWPRRIKTSTLEFFPTDRSAYFENRYYREYLKLQYSAFRCIWPLPSNNLISTPTCNSYYEACYTSFRTLGKATDSSLLDTVAIDSSIYPKYIGKLSIGDDGFRAYSNAYLQYDGFKKYSTSITWDTTQHLSRIEDTKYALGDLVPIAWDYKTAPAYTSAKKMQKLAKSYQQYYSISTSKESKEKKTYVVNTGGSKLSDPLERNFARNKKYSETLQFTKKSLSTITNENLEEKYAEKYIMDLWLGLDTLNDVYQLHIKTIEGIDDYDIEWWEMNGDTLKYDMAKNLKRYSAMQARTKSIEDRKNKRKNARALRKNRVDTSWNYFHNQVLRTEQEKKMTEAEWLAYKDKLQANEYTTLMKSDMATGLLSRALEISGYDWYNTFQWCKQYDSTHLHSVQAFGFDSAYLGLNVQDIWLYDSKNKAYTSFVPYSDAEETMLENAMHYRANLRQGSIFNSHKIVLPTGNVDQYAVLFYLNNGDLAVGRFLDNNRYTLYTEIIPRDLATIGTVFRMMNQ